MGQKVSSYPRKVLTKSRMCVFVTSECRIALPGEDRVTDWDYLLWQVLTFAKDGDRFGQYITVVYQIGRLPISPSPVTRSSAGSANRSVAVLISLHCSTSIIGCGVVSSSSSSVAEWQLGWDGMGWDWIGWIHARIDTDRRS